nr:MAG TPA: hypothetical protein [Caudoviricetes sp.]
MADKTTNKFTDKDWVRELFVVGHLCFILFKELIHG